MDAFSLVTKDIKKGEGFIVDHKKVSLLCSCQILNMLIVFVNFKLLYLFFPIFKPKLFAAGPTYFLL